LVEAGILALLPSYNQYLLGASTVWGMLRSTSWGRIRERCG
jgi:hypothetical protein